MTLELPAPLRIRRWIKAHWEVKELSDGRLQITRRGPDELVPPDVMEWLNEWSRGDGMNTGNGKVSANNASVQAQDNASASVQDNAADERKARIASAETKVRKAKEHLEGAKAALRKAKES